MLVTRRRPGESIRIDDRIEITVLSITPTKVALGIAAPQDVRIERTEVLLVARENTAASQPPARFAAALADRVGSQRDLLTADALPGVAPSPSLSEEPARTA